MLRVLLVEDDDLVRTALLASLTAEGISASELSDLDDVPASLAGREPPDVILADWRLPKGRTGGEVASEVRGFYGRNVPVAVLTGESSEVVNQLLSEGYPVIRKPTGVGDLIRHMVGLVQANAGRA